jgi:hypothetical protein
MILIAHRGNTNGRNPELENSPEYVRFAHSQGFDVEVDVWYYKGLWWLGHDEPMDSVSINFLFRNRKWLWIHCKNIEGYAHLHNLRLGCNYFFSDKDAATLTSFGYIWANVGQQPVLKSIAVLPEIQNEDVSQCVGICSDYIERYKKE